MSVYLLPGRGEPDGGLLGRCMSAANTPFHARPIHDVFSRLQFVDQLAQIRTDLVPMLWHGDACLVGRSYGAYLLLHTLADLGPFPGRILLCSPVLGQATARGGWYGSRPPRAGKLLAQAESGSFPVPGALEIHTGADDAGCDPQLAVRFAASVEGAEAHVVPRAAHDLPASYLMPVLQRFLQVRGADRTES